jgi:hypothetical protein
MSSHLKHVHHAEVGAAHEACVWDHSLVKDLEIMSTEQKQSLLIVCGVC